MIARQHCYCHCARAPRYIANSMAFNSVISSDVAHEGLRCPRSIAGFSVNKIGTELAALHGEQSAQMIPALESVVGGARRSEEHTSELQSLMRISYAVFCLKKKKQKN